MAISNHAQHATWHTNPRAQHAEYAVSKGLMDLPVELRFQIYSCLFRDQVAKDGNYEARGALVDMGERKPLYALASCVAKDFMDVALTCKTVMGELPITLPNMTLIIDFHVFQHVIDSIPPFFRDKVEQFTLTGITNHLRHCDIGNRLEQRAHVAALITSMPSLRAIELVTALERLTDDDFEFFAQNQLDLFLDYPTSEPVTPGFRRVGTKSEMWGDCPYLGSLGSILFPEKQPLFSLAKAFAVFDVWICVRWTIADTTEPLILSLRLQSLISSLGAAPRGGALVSEVIIDEGGSRVLQIEDMTLQYQGILIEDLSKGILLPVLDNDCTQRCTRRFRAVAASGEAELSNPIKFLCNSGMDGKWLNCSAE